MINIIFITGLDMIFKEGMVVSGEICQICLQTARIGMLQRFDIVLFKGDRPSTISEDKLDPAEMKVCPF